MNKLAITIFATCLTAMMAAPAYGEAPIGRLFTTSGERSNLEYLRKTKKNVPTKPEQPLEEESAMPRPAPVALPDAINLQGYVKRNDGKEGTVWVNNKALQEGTGNKEVAVGKLPENSNRIPIRITGDGRHIGLKAGQVYEPATNRVREAKHHAAQGDEGRIGGE